MKVTAKKLEEIIADGIAKAKPAIDAAAKCAADAALRAKGDAQAHEAAKLQRPSASHVPDAGEIQRAIGSPVPLRNLPDHDQVKAIMIASRGKR